MMRRTDCRLPPWSLPLLLTIVMIQGFYVFTDRFGQQAKDFLCGDLLKKENIVKSSLFSSVANHSAKPEASDGENTPPRKGGKTSLYHNNTTGSNDGLELRSSSTESKPKYYYKEPEIPNAGPNDFQGVTARAFEPWSGEDIPCLAPEKDWIKYKTQMSPTKTGLVFIKTFKTGSSTASGINLRISRNAARRQNKDFEMCKCRHDHAWAKKLVPNRDRKNSFLWSIVRDPSSRILSQLFHFQVSRNKKEPADSVFINTIRQGNSMTRDYYVSYLSTRRGKADPVERANAILEEYDFIAVTERMDESAVAMAMLMRIPLADILYLKAKMHGGFDDAGGRSTTTCTYIVPAFLSKGMDDFFRSDEWQERVKWDHVFYEAANRSLDLTIEKLGREEFEKNLALYLQAKERAHDVCLPKTTFPCSTGGKLNRETDCIWNDSGCGSDCLDEVATELNLW